MSPERAALNIQAAASSVSMPGGRLAQFSRWEGAVSQRTARSSPISPP
nr:hypothetical protein [Microbispora sp. KK1-11]